ncbi:hypothetical protein N9M81_03105 [Flavobacteriaceae bacterium]|jgi:hypothetical protein|nr:hypothetical protein [Flavobacteriaceae bacterium]
MKSKKKVVILTESQVKSLMDSLRVERDKRILSEMRNQYLLTDSISKQTGLTPGIKFKELEDPFPSLDEAAAKIVESINSNK